ncbi:hypothetical protein KR52_10215 [Synechococcus sp. KORDI-52]|nr:hypothetical protein KR52_10215 [Synechococcus sp. KORDI-52]
MCYALGTQTKLNDKQIAALHAKDSKHIVSLGNSLFLAIKPLKSEGKKGFLGRARVPPGQDGKQIKVRLEPQAAIIDACSAL